jgi:pimeloyl-ACP methyl ester carboxylesterase
MALTAMGLDPFGPDSHRDAGGEITSGLPGEIEWIVGGTRHARNRDRGPKDAAAVIMIHGTASHLQSFDDWAAGLEDRFRVVRLDLPGHGLSGPDPAGDYSDERGIELLDGASGPARHYTGQHDRQFAWAGALRWRFAAAHPGQHVEKLVLLAASGFSGMPRPSSYKQGTGRAGLAQPD